jgi:hypothetical protein
VCVCVCVCVPVCAGCVLWRMHVTQTDVQEAVEDLVQIFIETGTLLL